MPMLSRYSQYWFALIVVVFAAIALLYSQSVPVFEQSDEAEHTIYIHTLLQRGELPVIQSLNDMATEDDPIQRWNNQAHHAPLYYMLGAALVSWSSRDDIEQYLTPNELIFLRDTTDNNPNKWLHPLDTGGDTTAAVMTLRLANIIIGCLTLALVYRTTRELLPAGWALLATAFVASIPTFVVVHTGVTNDALTIFFYTAGILWSVRVWQAKRITWRDSALISIILAGIALTKLTGISLIGVIAGVLIVGAWQRRWSWQTAAQVIGVSLFTIALLSGWWYIRNAQLYGDLFAIAATNSIWGRSETLTLSIFAEDVRRIAQSFWFMVGYLHQPVYAPLAFYLYCGAITLIGIVGAIIAALRAKSSYDSLLLTGLGGICLLVIAMLLYGTRSVDISYGRLLLPAVAAFAVLMTIGWRQMLRALAPLVLLPLIGVAILAPLQIIPQAYPRLQPVERIPDTAQPIDITTDDPDKPDANLTIEAISIQQNRLQPDDTLSFDLYLRGSHADNPALLITAADSLRATRLGHIEIFPGMTSTRNLPDDTLYRLPVRVPLDNIPDEVRQPRVIMLLLRWVDVGANRDIPLSNGDTLYETPIATYHDPRYEAPTLPLSTDAVFADTIALDSVRLPESVTAGDTLSFTMHWNLINQLPDDNRAFAVPTIQLIADENNLIAQQDGLPYWYPLRFWLPDVPVTLDPQLSIPPETPAGDYILRVGWYHPTADGESTMRLPLTQGAGRDDLYPLSQRITIQPAP